MTISEIMQSLLWLLFPSTLHGAYEAISVLKNCMRTRITLLLSWHFAGSHDEVIKWPFVCVTHRSPVNSPYKGQWRGVLVFSLTCALINGWVNNSEAVDLRHHRAHYDVTVIFLVSFELCPSISEYVFQPNNRHRNFAKIISNTLISSTW